MHEKFLVFLQPQKSSWSGCILHYFTHALIYIIIWLSLQHKSIIIDDVANNFLPIKNDTNVIIHTDIDKYIAYIEL